MCDLRSWCDICPVLLVKFCRTFGRVYQNSYSLQIPPLPRSRALELKGTWASKQHLLVFRLFQVEPNLSWGRPCVWGKDPGSSARRLSRSVGVKAKLHEHETESPPQALETTFVFEALACSWAGDSGQIKNPLFYFQVPLALFPGCAIPFHVCY